MPPAQNRGDHDDERVAVTKESIVDDISLLAEDEWALVILWSAREPQRVGEVALLGNASQEWVLGRFPDSASLAEPSAKKPVAGIPTVAFFRQRPVGVPGGTFLEHGSSFVLGEGISRRQLLIEPSSEGLRLRNVGRCRLLINRQEVSTGLAATGATIHLKDQLLLYCVRRPRYLPAITSYPASCIHGFGQADAFGLVGESPVVWTMRDRSALLAQGMANILIIGESGSGKELAAQTIHGLSARRAKSLVSTNIAAIAPGLAPVQLFGNRKGFPESKMPESKGLVGAADGSTLFLDEIGDMPTEIQPMFLRVTDEDREYQRLGEEDKPPRRSDFRLIGATNRPEQLRLELKRRFARSLQIPSLHERREDIPLLVQHILSEYRRKGDAETERFFVDGQPQLHPLLIEYLLLHTYQTHVAEIGNLLGQAMALSRGRQIEACPDWLNKKGVARISRSGLRSLLPSSPAQGAEVPASDSAERLLPTVPSISSSPLPSAALDTSAALATVETVRRLRERIESLTDTEKQTLRTLIESNYQSCDGDFSKTAESLGLNRYQLYRLVHRLGWTRVRLMTLSSTAPREPA